MDGRLYDDVRSFVDCIKEIPEYKEYREKKKRMEENPEFLEKAELLMERNRELQEKLGERGDDLESVISFADENEEMLLDPEISGYLAAQAAFFKVMREVLDMMMEAVEL